MNIENVPEDSESSDEDYIPEAANNELPSEEESDGDEEDPLPNSEELNTSRGKRRRKIVKSRKKQKIISPTSPTQKSVEKQSTDDLWADFKKDTGFKTRAERQLNRETPIPYNKPSTTATKTETNETHLKANTKEPSKLVKVTEVFKFAGEEIKVEKEVNIASASNMPNRGAKGGGINSILSSLGKKTKISTLEKSKLDWDRFKKEEKIEDELQAYGKSKDGYLERQDFLQRADLRRFEIEKDIRSTLRTNRMNNL